MVRLYIYVAATRLRKYRTLFIKLNLVTCIDKVLSLSFDVYVANFLLNAIHCRVISNNLGQGKVKFYAFNDCRTTIVFIF